MSSHSIHTQSKTVWHDALENPSGGLRLPNRRQGGAAMTILDQAMVTVALIAIGYIAAIMFRWL